MNVARVMFTRATFSRKKTLMHLKAISIGDAVPRTDFDATVHSVFRSAVNLRPAKGSLLLTLIASGEADLPQGIRVNFPEGFSFERLCIGSKVICQDNFLDFENSSLMIELREAKRWKCDLPALGADMANPTVAAAWKCVWQFLNERQRRLEAEIVAEALFRSDEPAQSAISRRAGEAIYALLDATRRYNLDHTSMLNTLIGLGSGLTPSGDDLLVGYLAGLWCTVQDRCERVQSVSKLGKAVIHLSRQTNDISRTYLYHASQGQVSSRLADLAEVICRGENSDRILSSVESAMRVGHTSGMDAVTGLLIGLATWVSLGTPCT